MKIKEFEQKTGLKRSTIRFYETQGLLTPLVRPNGYREYSDSQVEAVQFIKLAQGLGFRLSDIARVSQAWREGALSRTQKLGFLQERLEACQLQQAHLGQLKHYLEALIGWVEGDETTPKPRMDALS
ncbi:MerR family transcriptional regulator [Oceanicaulis sp. MMSF_3324]|uniref:MerR family transcriptional regulator n=1 Tax=Oceanicaulis sp. MMSF_3324 TaxID=3046702 RepID=UPI00273F8E92|nr:MerR family transcriptional regulator [Oceanicaulis sp. MMSF_3324]